MLARLPAVKRLGFPDSRLRTEHVLAIRECKSLEVLRVVCLDLSEECIGDLAQLQSLKEIHLDYRPDERNFTIVKKALPVLIAV